MSDKPHPHEELGRARAHLAMLEAQLPSGLQYTAPIARLFAAIGGVHKRIRLLEAKLTPVVKEPA